jgi:DNA-binding beta-propeller fold protein YncE
MNTRRMIARTNRLGRLGLAVLLSLGLMAAALGAAGKVRVKQPKGAQVYRQPAIGQPITTFPLGKVLDTVAKAGDWYKLTFELNGVETTGYIHSMLVDEVNEGDLTGSGGSDLVKTQDQTLVEIGLKIETIHGLVVREQELPAQVDSLHDLLPDVLRLDDVQKQRQLACDIYLLAGKALSMQGDDGRAIREFKNMFTVDYPYAKKSTKYETDPNISLLIETAEKQYSGTFVDFAVQVETNPKDAAIKVNGKYFGQSPDVVSSPVPRITLEIEKEGYRAEKAVLSLTGPKTIKTFELQSVARMIHVDSDPKGASVFLDGRDSGKMTDCDLGLVPYGSHKLIAKKPGYGDWEQDLVVEEGSGPLSYTAVLPAKSYYPVLTWAGLDNKGTAVPRQMTLDAEGSFYIVSDGSVKVRKFNRDRGGLPYWGQDNKDLKGLKEPAGIAVGPDGSCYIADKKSGSVLKVDKSGKTLRRLGRPGTKDGELMQPAAVAVDRTNNVYVLDTGTSRIVKYAPTGAWVKSWGKQGPGQGEFNYPGAVTVNSKNEIVVVDAGRIQKFTPDGAFVATFGKQGPPEAEFKRAQGVSCDAQDCIYVADPSAHRVLKFQADGRFVGTFGSYGAEVGQLSSPVAAVVDGKGNIFVLETGNRRIQQFQPPAK